MPIYDYRCQECGWVWEVFMRSMGDTPHWVSPLWQPEPGEAILRPLCDKGGDWGPGHHLLRPERALPDTSLLRRGRLPAEVDDG